ncbi:hypothetical protein OUZ56_016661 [Daphnia magna]|uniref:Uncharacterized protein n=1 Tax=Daphnia magna TaxID=35525 RepID=A0ABR0ARM4_9CRUS|nr:hypothetical protein OUZ56_016661 [Daphnia magna]
MSEISTILGRGTVVETRIRVIYREKTEFPTAILDAFPIDEGAIPRYFLTPNETSRQPLQSICNVNRRNNSIANPTVDEKCRKHPNKERYAFTKKSSLNKKISYDLATPMEVVPDENLSVEKQLPAMAKKPASVVVETIPTLPTMVKLTPMDDVQDPNTSNESELNITTEETVNENAEIKLSQLAHTSSTAQSYSTTDESIWTSKLQTKLDHVHWSGVGCFRTAKNSPIFQVSSASFVSLSLLQLAV